MTVMLYPDSLLINTLITSYNNQKPYTLVFTYSYKFKPRVKGRHYNKLYGICKCLFHFRKILYVNTDFSRGYIFHKIPRY